MTVANLFPLNVQYATEYYEYYANIMCILSAKFKHKCWVVEAEKWKNKYLNSLGRTVKSRPMSDSPGDISKSKEEEGWPECTLTLNTGNGRFWHISLRKLMKTSGSHKSFWKVIPT